jgi:hypothetical protein
VCKGSKPGDNRERSFAVLVSVTSSRFSKLNPTASDNVSFPVQDGTILVSSRLATDGSKGYAKDVAVLDGTVRDETGINVPPVPVGIPLEVWFAQAAALGIDPTPILANRAAFGIPENPTAADIFNVTVRAATDGFFKCAAQTTVYGAAKSHAFKKTYAYVFNRTYSPANYTAEACKAPPTANHPFGDPSLEYYKCHGGEQLITFGNLLRVGMPDRDGLDVPFMQLVIDYWASFVRTRDPNPDKKYLATRGYHGTLEHVNAVGAWTPVDVNSPEMELLQWGGGMVPFREVEQCALLGLPLTAAG